MDTGRVRKRIQPKQLSERLERARRLPAAIKENRWRVFVIALFLTLAAWGIVLDTYSLVLGHSELALLLTTTCTGVAPELAGIVIGVVTIDYLNERRQEQQFRKQLKQQLKRDMLSGVRDFAVRAVDELTYYGWVDEILEQVKDSLDGAILDGVKLSNARLNDARLRQASLKAASLFSANLQRAYLIGVDLEGANLQSAELCRARLSGANLQYANLMGANLQKADLTGANLQHASLMDANLQDAVLHRASLQDADLFGAELRGAVLIDADLEGSNLMFANLHLGHLVATRSHVIKQLSQAKTLARATMPDGTKLRGGDGTDGSTLEEWAESYLQTEDSVDQHAVEEALDIASYDDEEE